MNTDTFSGFPVATALRREATKSVISHCLCCFPMVGVTNQIVTDNGTGYYSQAFEMLCWQVNVTHIIEIPYNSQKQDIVMKIVWNFKTITS